MHRRQWSGAPLGRTRSIWWTVATVAATGLGVAGLTIGPLMVPAAGASTPSSPSVVGDTAWCGHFNHAAADSISPSFQCPAVSGSLVTLVTDAPNGPFSSGQYIDVSVAANGILDPGKRIYIRECEAPNGQLPSHWDQCDTRTNQSARATVGPHGIVSYLDYPIFALPDKTVLHEHWKHKPVCDLTHACILFVGQDRHDFDRPHVWSSPFYVKFDTG